MISTDITVLDTGDYSLFIEGNLSIFNCCHICVVRKKNRNKIYLIKEVLSTPPYHVLYFNMNIKKKFRKNKQYVIEGYYYDDYDNLEHRKTIKEIVKQKMIYG